MEDEFDEYIDEEEYVGLLEEWGLTFGRLLPYLTFRRLWPYLLALFIIFILFILYAIWSALNQYGEGMAAFQG